MRYFATWYEGGLIVRGANSPSDFPDPEERGEVTDIIREHANENGMAALNGGKRMTFDAGDLSYWPLAARLP